jgi:hypothetical protein
MGKRDAGRDLWPDYFKVRQTLPKFKGQRPQRAPALAILVVMKQGSSFQQ